MAKYVATTPRMVTPAILDFCRELGGTAPVYVTIYEPKGRLGMCFQNAEIEAIEGGGEVVYGWAIWEYPGVYLTAEYHALVERDGMYVDTTPQFDGSRRMLFLPTLGATRPTCPVINRYRPLADHPLVTRLIALQVANLRLSFEGKFGSPRFRANDEEVTRCLEAFLRKSRRR